MADLDVAHPPMEEVIAAIYRDANGAPMRDGPEAKM
jgi:hypothetical protein